MEANVTIVEISESHLWSFCTQNNVNKNSWTPTNRMSSPRGSQKYVVGKRCTVLLSKVFQEKKNNKMRDKWPLGRISGVKFEYLIYNTAEGYDPSYIISPTFFPSFLLSRWRSCHMLSFPYFFFNFTFRAV